MTTLLTWRHSRQAPILFLARARERECFIYAIQWVLTGSGKLLQICSIICWRDLKKWTHEYLPKWNQKSEWSKEHAQNLNKSELVWLIDYSSELWLTGTNHFNRHGQRLLCAISRSQNGTWGAEPASHENSREQKQDQRCWRHFASATRAIGQQEINFDNEKHLDIVKIKNGQNWKKLTCSDKKFSLPPTFERETLSNPRHTLGKPLSYPRT